MERGAGVGGGGVSGGGERCEKLSLYSRVAE